MLQITWSSWSHFSIFGCYWRFSPVSSYGDLLFLPVSEIVLSFFVALRFWLFLRVLVTGRVPVAFVYWLSLFMGFVSFLCNIKVLSYLNLACAGWVIITLYNIFVTILGCFHNIAFYDILVTVIRLFFLSSHSFGALWGGVC